jgi:response regulator RpfG family c-di-GMP phosphodiesterase
MTLASSLRLVEKMMADGLITQEHQEATINHIQRTGDRLEEALLEIRAVDEASLLKYLAALHRTRFVSTEKLAKAEIDRLTIDKVPKRLAEQYQMFPVLYDPASNVLSIVTADPDNAQAIQECQMAANAKVVRAFVGRPRAIKAAIAKAYNGDIHAFAALDRQAQEQFGAMLDVYERNLINPETLAAALSAERPGRERILTSKDIEKGGGFSMGAHSVAADSYRETLNVLVTLIESTRPDLRGHSSYVARLMRKIAERIGLPEMERANAVMAAYAHDLGKMGEYHLTAFNVAQYDQYRTVASKLYKAPSRLMEAVKLPREVTSSIEQMYERYDGDGLPGAMHGKEISLIARLLAVADTYADLTQNPKNPFRKMLDPAQACEVLARCRGSVYDPNIVDLFRLVVTGDDLKARLLATRHVALVVDPDPEETTVLELRMFEQGFDVRQARDTDAALKFLEAGDIQVVVSEIDLQPLDGFGLLALARKHAWGAKLPWIFLTGRAGGSDAARAFESGVADYVTKPVSADLLIAKIKQIIEREASGRAGGVTGSLSEMGLPELIQVLTQGRKTGALKIRGAHDAGELHFVQGNVYNGLYANSRGAEAVYSMLGLKEGTFMFDPNFEAPQRLITESPEALLLEGMRRSDEGVH